MLLALLNPFVLSDPRPSYLPFILYQSMQLRKFIFHLSMFAAMRTSMFVSFIVFLLLTIALWMVGAVEYKLFVGSLNKQATEKEVEEVCCTQTICYHLRLVFSSILSSWCSLVTILHSNKDNINICLDGNCWSNCQSAWMHTLNTIGSSFGRKKKKKKSLPLTVIGAAKENH